MRKVVSSVFVVATLLSLQVVVVSAQNTDTVRLVTTGSGMSETEAVQVALRSAVEQAYGVFISSDTQILNDELVKDEIVSISSGNVVGYELVSVSQADDGTYHLMVSSEVSLGKLSSFVTARGGSSDFKGGLFGFAIKQQQLNEANELSTIESLVYQLDEIASRSFDYEIQPGQPRQEEDGTWAIPVEITATANANFEVYKDILEESLRSISLSASERDQYREMNKEVWPVTLGITEDRYVRSILRNQASAEKIANQILSLNSWITNFDVSNGVNEWPLIRKSKDPDSRWFDRFLCDDTNLGLNNYHLNFRDPEREFREYIRSLFVTTEEARRRLLPGELEWNVVSYLNNKAFMGFVRFAKNKKNRWSLSRFKFIQPLLDDDLSLTREVLWEEGRTYKFGFLFSFLRPSPESGPASMKFLAYDIVTLETLNTISDYTVKRRNHDANQRININCISNPELLR